MTTETIQPPKRSPRRRSFAPRYPGWLTAPSLIYYMIFFLGPLAILVVFSVATQAGFGGVTYTFSTTQFKALNDPLYIKVFRQTMLMAAGGTAHMSSRNGIRTARIRYSEASRGTATTASASRTATAIRSCRIGKTCWSER